ncbi:MAG: hypothetical protein NC400_06720 [Clostridium sp.]|nr:hypothetical protein [Clostridium sp.]
MEEKWEVFRASLSDETSMSKKEFLLTLAVCVLGGIVFGMLFSPKKFTMIGSQNGHRIGDEDGVKGKKKKKKNGVVDWEDVEEKEL